MHPEHMMSSFESELYFLTQQSWDLQSGWLLLINSIMVAVPGPTGALPNVCLSSILQLMQWWPIKSPFDPRNSCSIPPFQLPIEKPYWFLLSWMKLAPLAFSSLAHNTAKLSLLLKPSLSLNIATLFLYNTILFFPKNQSFLLRSFHRHTKECRNKRETCSSLIIGALKLQHTIRKKKQGSALMSKACVYTCVCVCKHC